MRTPFDESKHRRGGFADNAGKFSVKERAESEASLARTDAIPLETLSFIADGLENVRCVERDSLSRIIADNRSRHGEFSSSDDFAARYGAGEDYVRLAVADARYRAADVAYRQARWDLDDARHRRLGTPRDASAGHRETYRAPVNADAPDRSVNSGMDAPMRLACPPHEPETFARAARYTRTMLAGEHQAAEADHILATCAPHLSDEDRHRLADQAQSALDSREQLADFEADYRRARDNAVAVRLARHHLTADQRAALDALADTRRITGYWAEKTAGLSKGKLAAVMRADFNTAVKAGMFPPGLEVSFSAPRGKDTTDTVRITVGNPGRTTGNNARLVRSRLNRWIGMYQDGGRRFPVAIEAPQ